MSDKTHTYSNGEVTIIWTPSLCTHSKRCWHGLPDVFKPGEKPWIIPEGADTKAIVDQVCLCPSGALSIRVNTKEDRAQDDRSIPDAT
jgi:uncharacterized Fe-S cluster protein YjdI